MFVASGRSILTRFTAKKRWFAQVVPARILLRL
jgi:hypothetical protein